MHFGKKTTLKDRAQDYVETLTDSVVPQLEAALADARDVARDKAAPALAEARDQGRSLAHDARVRAMERTAEAREHAGPMVHEAKAKARDKAAKGKAKAAGTAAVASALAADKAAEGRDAARAKVAALKGEKPQKGGKVKKFLLLGGLLAVAGVVAKMLQGKKSSSTSWQSSYVPTPPPAAPVTPSAPQSGGTHAATSTAGVNADVPDDTAGANPGEAITDAQEHPQPVTDPDNPVEVVEIDDSPQGSGHH